MYILQNLQASVGANNVHTGNIHWSIFLADEFLPILDLKTRIFKKGVMSMWMWSIGF